MEQPTPQPTAATQPETQNRGVTKKCLHCGNEFQALKSSAKYCSDYHRLLAFKQRRVEQPKQDLPIETPKAMSISSQRPPIQLDPVTQFMINRLESEIKDLKESNTRKETKIETLTREKSELEKEVQELEGQLSAKPTGLSGIVQTNPGIIEKVFETMGPHLGESLGKLISKFTDGGDVMKGLPEADAINNFLMQQTEEVRKAFYSMINSLVMQQAKIKDNLDIINKILAGSASSANTGRMGTGIGR